MQIIGWHMSQFYLGTHITSWLRRTDVPLFVSHRRLQRLRQLPKAKGRWMLDSGGFTELSMFGQWETPAPAYARAVRRYADEIGGLDGAAIQDWMCEPFITQKTGLPVVEHQRRTVRSYLDLMSRDSSLPWMPVLQGWTQGDYLRCIELYEKAGIDLTALPRVGLGSVCRRQGTKQIAALVRMLASQGLKLHGFGFKLKGLALVADVLASSDSLAWSYDARRSAPLAQCSHKSCANCYEYAHLWCETKIMPLINRTDWQLRLDL